MLNEILDKCKSHGEKRGLKYINKVETLTSGKKKKKLFLLKVKNKPLAIQHLPILPYFAHTLKSLDKLKIGVILNFLRCTSLN